MQQSPDDQEKDNARQIKALIERQFEATKEIADALNAKDYEAARQIYREKGQDTYSVAIRLVQSSIGNLQKRLGKTLLQIRVVK